MSFLNRLKKKLPTIRFASYTGNFSVATPVAAASRVRPDWVQAQLERDKGKRFHNCPGMLDYAMSGYIVTAHTDIHIKANKVGVVVKVVSTNADNSKLPIGAFDVSMVEGMTKLGDDVKPYAAKITLPWSVQAREGYSAYVLPALMHSDFLDDLFVYPGVIDFDGYHVINFVFSPKRACELTIPAGTPLLHVLPFKREAITAECDKATEQEVDKHLFNMPSRIRHYYRRFLASRKSFAMKCPYDHRG